MFFGAITSLALGILGQYLWLCLQNSRSRPAFIVASSEEYAAARLAGQTVSRQPAAQGQAHATTDSKERA
jgi:hypothetical protein